MGPLEKLSFKDLEEMVSAIAEKFFFAKGYCDYQSADRLAEEDDQYEDFLLKVQEAYALLDECDKSLINNEFFYQSYSQWWRALYSKATFYRYKKEAMQRFLGAFYHV